MAGEPGGALGSVSVVVPTIGRARLAATVAGALRDPATAEVVVVADRDRHAVDAVLAADGLDAESRVVVVPGAGRGPAAAREVGIARARGEIVLLLDDDVVPETGLVSAHCEAHAGRDRLIVVGPMPVADELRRSSAIAHVYANDYDAEWSGLVADPTGVARDLWGGNVSLRRVDALAVPPVGDLGDLRNREDQEWGLRAGRAGLIGAVAPHAGAVHWHDGRAAQLLDAAADQVRTERLLVERYPEIVAGAAPGDGLPRPARALVDLADGRVFGGMIRRATVGAARRFGDGPPARWRVGLLVVARAMVQRGA